MGFREAATVLCSTRSHTKAVIILLWYCSTPGFFAAGTGASRGWHQGEAFRGMGNEESTMAPGVEAASAEEQKQMQRYLEIVEDVETLRQRLMECGEEHELAHFREAFVFAKYAALAQTAALHDAVGQARFKVVPSRVPEDEFWVRFFYLVSTYTPPRPLPPPQPLEPLHCILRVRLCFVYPVPKSETQSDYLASQWDLENPIYTGRLELGLSTGGDLYMCLYERDGKALFAHSAPISLAALAKGEATLSYFLNPVQDSSRYFVLLVQDGTAGQRARIGIGFKDRSHAFDLNAAITEAVDQEKRVLHAGAGTEVEEEPAAGQEKKPPSTGVFKLKGKVRIRKKGREEQLQDESWTDFETATE